MLWFPTSIYELGNRFVQHNLDLLPLLDRHMPGQRKVRRKEVAKRRAKNAQARKARKTGKGGAKPAKNLVQSRK